MPPKQAKIPLNNSFWLLTGSVSAVLLLRRIVQEGMSSDGLIYASISRNLAIGKGSLWAPYLSSSYWLPYQKSTIFFEHPPAWFWVESLFFKVLGDGVHVEKLISALVTVGILGLIVLIWNTFFKDSSETKQLSWLPLLILCSFQLTEWVFAQNLLDAPVTLVSLANIFLLLKATRGHYSYLAVGVATGLLVMLGLLIKGPFILPVLAAPFTLALVGGQRLDWKRAILVTGLQLTVLVIVALGLYIYEPSRLFFDAYFRQQVVAALLNKRENIADINTFGQLQQAYIFLVNVAPAAVLGMFLHKNWGTSLRISNNDQRCLALWMLAMSMCVLLPQLLLKKQIDYYLTQLLPYVALGLAGWLASPAEQMVRKLSLHMPQLVRVGSVVCLLGGGLYLGAIAGGPYPSQRGYLEDLRLFSSVLKPASKLCVSHSVMNDYPSHAYWQRYHRIEFRSIDSRCQQIMTFKDDPFTPPKQYFRRFNIGGSIYALYKKKHP